MSDANEFTTIPSTAADVRYNLAVFARRSTKDSKGRLGHRIEGLMVVLEHVYERDGKGEPVRGANGKTRRVVSAGLPGGSIDEMPPDVIAPIINAYLGDVKVQMYDSYRPSYEQRPQEVVQEYIIATVDCGEDGSLPAIMRPDGCPEAQWVTWKTVADNHESNKRSVLRSLFVLFKAISWTQGKVPEPVRGWVVATRPPKVGPRTGGPRPSGSSK